MHISDFKYLTGIKLALLQEKVFTAFLNDDLLDIGLGSLRASHIKGALYLVEEHANVKGLKKWHPNFDMLQAMLPSYDIQQKLKL